MNNLRASLFALLAYASIADAQQFPTKPIRFILPYSPGGGMDLVLRTIGQKLTDTLGQIVVVENRWGAQGNVGTALAAKAKPDGYTLMLGEAGALCINPHLYANVGFDTQKHFAPITLATQQPYLVVVHPSVPAQSLQELISLAKANPNKLTFGTSSSVAQISGEWMKHVAGFTMTHIPYKGAAPAMIDLIGVRLDLTFSSPAGPMPFIRSGRLRVLAVTTRARVDFLPDVPTVIEAGVPDYEMAGWYGVFAPVGTSREIVMQLNAQLVQVLRLPDVKERFAREGIQTVGNLPDEFADFIKVEFAKWGKAVQTTGVKAE